MCGRAYHTYTEEELELRYFNEKRKHNHFQEFEPNYNLCPTQRTPVVLIRNHAITIEPMRFGLIPFWAKELKDASKYNLINAKGEEITEKKTYQAAFQQRRCIIPLSGFFEWQKKEGGSKIPHAIYFKNHSILSVAGVWERWKSDSTPEEITSFSIITTQANAFMEQFHSRMPVILNPQDEFDWLNPLNKDLDQLKKYLKPCPNDWLSQHAISPLVNSPKNNSKELLEPLQKEVI